MDLSCEINDDYDHFDNDLEYILENVLSENIRENVNENNDCKRLHDLFNSFLLNKCECEEVEYPQCSKCLHGSNYIYDKQFQELVLSDSENRLDVIYECSQMCSCKPGNCMNRLVQYGPRKFLKIVDSFQYGSKGLITTCDIPKNAFICEYAGELLTMQEAKMILRQNELQNNMNYVLFLKESCPTSESNSEILTIVDPSRRGNIGRYINHSCDPNCHIKSVRIDCPIPKIDTEMDVTSENSSRPLSHCQSACSYGSSSMDDHDDLNAKDDDMTFCMANYAKKALKMMFMMRSHNMLTDVILEVKQELFPAHKVVLSAASPYFKAMFTGGLKETEMSRVQLQGVCPTAMGRIIYFMYTGHIRVTEVTVCQLLPAATMFQVPNVIDACCAFLERQLDPTNAIGIASFAEQHGCTELQKKANHFIERHFTQVCQEEEFLQLSAYQLIALIRRDELNVQGEREVYNAVLKWVKYDEENRYPKMEHILFSVRCQLLTPTFLREQMKNCDVLRKVPACREYLAKIFKDLTLHKRPVVKERKPNTTRMIFVAGGFFRQSLDILEAYNVDDKTWTTLRSLRIPRSGLGAAFLKGVFYAVGGRNNSIGSSYDSDWVDRYNALTEQWRPCAPMTVPRHRVGVAVMDELMYAVGGSAGSEYHNTVEYYDPELDRWFPVQPMHAKRLGVGVVVVNRLLYAVGGFNGTERLASVERYHPENNAWSFVPPMTCGRSGAGVAAINQYIYVVGGFDGTRQLSSVERFDTENQVWEHVAPIKIARSALSLTSLDGKLYAIGGFDGTNFLSIVEVYDPKTNTWEQGTPLSSGRSGHASAVIFQPSCVNNFMMDCIEDDSSNRDGSGPGSNDSPSDENSSDQPGGSRPDGGNSSFVGFQTSFGSSGCRNCENELVPTSGEQEIMNNDNENTSNDTLAPPSTSIPIRDIPHRKRRTRWTRKMCEMRNEEANATETPVSNVQAVPLLQQPVSFSNPSNDIENSTNLINTKLNNIKTNANTSTLPPPNVKRKNQPSQFKSKCLIEVIRKCNARNVVQDYLNSLLEKHSKKFVTL